jgi:hypothetical protein
VNETGQPYAYTGDDPVNAVDPLGMTSEGYCFNVTGSVLFATGSVQICAVEVNDNSQVGITLTGGGGFGFNTAQFLNTFSNPASLKKLFSVSGTLDYQRSNANNICSLGGLFENTTLTGGIGPVTGTFTHFTAASGTHGSEVGAGLRPCSDNWSISLAEYPSYGSVVA